MLSSVENGKQVMASPIIQCENSDKKCIKRLNDFKETIDDNNKKEEFNIPASCDYDKTCEKQANKAFKDTCKDSG